jgi:hypothetical protein
LSGIVCSRCGHQNTVDASYCSSCGHDLADAAGFPTTENPVLDLDDSGEEVDLSEVAEGLATFVVKRGPKAGSRYGLDEDVVTIGRHPDSEIFLDDITVSRRHAEVRRDGSTYEVADVGSLNGTYVNRQRIESAVLDDGDELQVGKFKLVFFRGAADG